ncbi:Ppx/GppA phosphatase family protein [Campylobacter sp.]|uniref:Ppx/GppA phosphatase family protein n=1 Tax=Campylobacter sp. TaxID=205 RepID=UPI00271020E2|nr:Ppx/GppA phosphatase family protein [Campylobacter sp.]
MAKRTAVIDIGSNSMRMAIFQKTSRYAFYILGEFKMKVRLGEGAYDEGGTIGEKSMKKAIEALGEFKNIAKSYKCHKIFCMGTSALRDAPNSTEFIAIVRKKLGLNLKIVKGVDEANFGAVAALNLLEPLKDFITIDIGGGSTELALIKDGKISDSVSLDVGTVRLKELFFDKKNLKGLDGFMKEILKQLPENFKSKNVVAIGGSLRAISNSIMELQNYALKSVHNFSYKFSDYKGFIKDLTESSVLDLAKFHVKKERFDTIREGAFIFLSIASRIECERVYTSGAGLREGIYLSDLLRPSKKFPPNFNPSVKSLQDRFLLASNKAVVKYAKDIFDALKPLHGIEDKFVRELEVAAKLYNIGQCLGFYGEHINSSNFVISALNYGFSHEQKSLIATVIGMNGKKNLAEFERFKSLLPDENTVRWLSFMLNLAKNLDINCMHKKLKFEFINHTLQISGAKENFMAKESLRKIAKPATFALIFV